MQSRVLARVRRLSERNYHVWLGGERLPMKVTLPINAPHLSSARLAKETIHTSVALLASLTRSADRLDEMKEGRAADVRRDAASLCWARVQRAGYTQWKDEGDGPFPLPERSH